MAHSAGGGCLSAIQKQFEDSFYNTVKKVAFTDSWVIGKNQLNEAQQKWMFENAVHYVSSDEPVGTHVSVEFMEETCPVLSAGHPKHEYTTGYC